MTGVAFTADGTKLVSGSQDKTFRVLNLADQMQLASIETPAPVNAVALVAEGKQVATGGADNIIRLWDLPAAAARRSRQARQGNAGPRRPGHVARRSSPTGVQLLSGSKDGTVRVWDVAAGNAVKNMDHGAPVEAVAARADGKRFVSVSSNNTAKLWNGENQQQVAEIEGRLPRHARRSPK